MSEASSLSLPGRAPAAPIGGSRRRSGAKHDYLRRAAALAATAGAGSGTASPFAHVSLGAVAAAAGVSRSALYRLWPSQHEFWDELQSFVLAGEPAPADKQPPGAVEHDIAPDGTVHDAVQDLLLSSRDPLVEIGLIGHPVDAVSRAQVAERRAERIGALTMELERDLAVRGAVCAGNVSVGDLAVALTMIGTGLPITGRLVRHPALRFDSDAYTAPSEAGRSLFGSLQVAVRSGLTSSGDVPTRDDPTRAHRVRSPTPAAPTGRRLEYLRIAAALAIDPDVDGHGVGRALHYLTLDSLSRALGLTRRTLGNMWPDQASFRLDLFAFLLRSQRDELAQALRASRRAATSDGRCDSTTLFLDLGDRIHAALVRRRNELGFLAFAPHLDDVHVADRARREHDQALMLIRHALELLLQSAGARPRPGVTPEHLTVAFLVVCDGANRLVRTDPALVGSVSGCDASPRSVTAVTLATVLAGLTEPVDTRPQVARYLRLVS